MSKHMPGPWYYNRITGEIGANAAQFTICKLPTIDLINAKAPQELIVESEANGYLLAVAPELLEALEMTLISLEIGAASVEQVQAREMARRVIAKAKGEI